MHTPHKHKKEKEKKLVGKERQQKEAKYTSIYTKQKKKGEKCWWKVLLYLLKCCTVQPSYPENDCCQRQRTK